MIIADSNTPIPTAIAPIMHEIAEGMELKKCHKCGCMQEALAQAKRAFNQSENAELLALKPVIEQYQEQMEPISYDCLGCKKCWGADATIQIANHFEDVGLESCGSGCNQTSTQADPVVIPKITENSWTLQPGDYVVGNPNGAVAVCTLSSRNLAAAIVERASPDVAIAGRCDTENIGVEKVVQNLIANSSIRWLILCGIEAQGHRTGDAFVRLKERGVDTQMRVLESASWRPVLKNLTLKDVARFREQVEVVNLIGITDVDTIAQTIYDCATRSLPPLTDFTPAAVATSIEHIKAQRAKHLKLDPAGFFVILPQPETGLIICEHYQNNGQLAHVIEGRQAAQIVSTAIEQGFVTLLEHAAYLGRELMKAEMFLNSGIPYEQDTEMSNVPSQLETAPAAEIERSSCGCNPASATCS